MFKFKKNVIFIPLIIIVSLLVSPETVFASNKNVCNVLKKQKQCNSKNNIKSSKPTNKKKIVSQSPNFDQVSNTNNIATDYLESKSSLFKNLEECKLKSKHSDFTSFGFPRPKNAINNSGLLKAILIFVEFKDVRGSDNPTIEGKKFTKNFEQFYKTVSYNKLNFEVDIHPNYIFIDKNSIEYGMNRYGYGDPGKYFTDGVKYSDKFVDFSFYDLVFFIPPSDIKEIVYGPAVIFMPVDRHTNEKNILSGAVGGSDFRNSSTSRWVWLAHEVGHALSMDHQYDDSFHKPTWDLMDSMGDETPEFFAWNRFLQGWLEESNIKCIDSSLSKENSIIVSVSDLSENNNKTKSIIVKLTDSTALVVEARKSTGFNFFEKGEEGILAYIVDASKKRGQGAISIINENISRLKTIKVGESVISNNLKILNVKGAEDYFIVKIERL